MYKNCFGIQLESFKESLKILNQSKKTIISYESSIRHFLKWLIEKKIYDLKEVTFETIKEYQLFLLNKPYSLNTIHVNLRSLRRFFEYLERNRYILVNPTEKIIFPKLGNRLSQNILSEEEVSQLLAMPDISTPRGIRDKALLELLYSTGIRKDECANLNVSDVDYKGGSLRVNQGKGAKDRVIPLGTKACEAIKKYILNVRPQLIEHSDTKKLFICIKQGGRPLGDVSLAFIVKVYGRQAGIKQPVNIHAIRRSVATHLLRNEAHPLYIQRILGHSTGETLRQYIKVVCKDVKKTHSKSHPREKDRNLNLNKRIDQNDKLLFNFKRV